MRHPRLKGNVSLPVFFYRRRPPVYARFFHLGSYDDGHSPIRPIGPILPTDPARYFQHRLSNQFQIKPQ